MTKKQFLRYVRAGEIMDIAMGPVKHPAYRGERASDRDPLAYWCGVFAIVDLVNPVNHLAAPESSHKEGGR